MNRIINIFLLAYYAIGTLCLPMGDFASMQDVPGMYRYCKSSEQQELTLFGFVAGHLLNLDGMSDVRDHHDTRKSHATPPKHHQHVKVYGVVAFVQQPSTKSLSGPVHKDYARDEFYLSDYQSDIFHPPSV